MQKELAAEVLRRSNSSHIHKLSRVEQFVPYRNMLLRELRERSGQISESADITFDYLWMLDPEVFDIDFKSFMYELTECPTDVMCINGVDPFGDYRFDNERIL